jgi:osmotically-inducible protein OsmY
MRNKTKALSAAGAALILITSTGCESMTGTTRHDERSEGRVLDDKNITTGVQKGLDSEPAFKFTGVKVNTFAGIVQLSGFVNTDDQKQRAEALAEGTPGVRQVINGIAIKPEMPTAPTGRPSAGSRIYAEPTNPTMPGNQEKQEPNQPATESK